jgi:hypothetical protein
MQNLSSTPESNCSTKLVESLIFGMKTVFKIEPSLLVDIEACSKINLEY